MYAYMDNAATTRLSEAAKAAMLPLMEENYGNPSSLHRYGQRAAAALQSARERVAACINADPREITFTSGGSEADNQAVFSAAMQGAKAGKRHIVSTQIEHHAVLHYLKALEPEGFTVTLLPVEPDTGLVRPPDLEAALTGDTCLVTVMMANNEIGAVQPIEEIARLCRARKIPFHTDAVQAVGHVPVDVRALGADMLSLAAHKFHGPKGAGALYCRGGGAPPRPVLLGGAQERGRRAGTENLPAIAGMAAALEEAVAEMPGTAARVAGYRDRLIEGLSKIDRAHLNGDRARRLPGNVSFCFEGLEGEALLLLLDDRGVAASSGSACTSGSLDPSHVLLAIGRPHEVAHGSLRLSLSRYTTQAEVDHALAVVPPVVEYLRGISPVWERILREERGEGA
ncbi:MAG: aminotransferase class V-fold PLP-dependent enzyme [Oscillospiraceae bacterium]|jgi:cysteine desulfurase|nr:aminotransferase class V-fold PLP-dependent enzyme [Oscillospiraceae bacterium]